MPAVPLKDVLDPAMRDSYAIAGMVVLGWEDAVAYLRAAEELKAPLILQAGPGCRKHTPIRVLGAMFRELADKADVPVVCHVDHAFSFEECQAGIDHGFTSVMYDGSKLPIDENIETTARIVEHAHAAGVSVEGEVGTVGYADGVESHGTRPDEAERFDRETGVDALAVSIGNVHLMQSKSADVDMALLREVEAATRSPLVLHGGSGLALETRTLLARTTRVSKINIGTELRMAFGTALRQTLAADPKVFDRIAIMSSTVVPLTLAARNAMAPLLGPR